MSRLNGVTLAGNGRIISETMAYDKVLNPGIKTHNYLGKIFAEIFGTGTVTVQINDKKYYLNRGSCYNLLNLNHIDHTHKKKDFLPKIQTLFDKMHVNDLFQPNVDSPSESLSKHDLASQKSKDKSIDSTQSESSETPTRESTGSESSDDIETMRNTIASLTKRLEDLVNLTYEKYAERTIQSLVSIGVDQKTAEEALEDWGQSEYQSKIEELKSKISQIQTDLINKLAATSSQSNDSSSSESLIETQKPQPKTDPVKEVEPTISEEPVKSTSLDPIQSMKDDLALWKKELEDLKNCPFDDFIQQEIDQQVANGTEPEKAKEAAEAVGQLQYEYNIFILETKISTAEETLKLTAYLT